MPKWYSISLHQALPAIGVGHWTLGLVRAGLDRD
jgi:hypothetical protein